MDLVEISLVPLVGSKVITRNNCSRAEGSLGTTLVKITTKASGHTMVDCTEVTTIENTFQTIIHALMRAATCNKLDIYSWPEITGLLRTHTYLNCSV